MKLIVAIVQDEDAGRLVSALMDKGFGVTKLATTGGFLRAGNTTLISGVEDDKLQDALDVIEKICKSREQITASTTPMGGAGGVYVPYPIRVTVGGADLADLPAAWVRDHVGVVLQEPFLFSRTIEENIGICGADHAAVCKAAETACIAADIEQFADGYQTMVGERGVTLSGGQKQRVAIARMLTKKTPIMVFDDSLSAVDTETDEKIRSALDRDLGGATTIIISHRITTLMDCDNVLVLERGKLLQYGPPQTLLQADGLFRQIYDMQMSIGEEEPA